MLKKNFIKQSGFTLIEILMAVIITSILASIIVPRMTLSDEDAKISALKSNLKILRKAIEYYHLQHDNTYPGSVPTDSKNMELEEETKEVTEELTEKIVPSKNLFIDQLLQYTDIKGNVSVIKNNIYKFGPYLKTVEFPKNPFNNYNNVKCDIVTTDITERLSDGSSGWKFYTKTGILMANDGNHDDL